VNVVKRPPGLILDIDGAILRGDQVIPGTVETIAELRRRGHPVVFITNALESPTEQANRLTKAGIIVSEDEIITAPQVLEEYLRQNLPDATIYVISDSPLPESLAKDFRLSENPDEIDAVIVSCDRNFNFRKLNIGYQALRLGARFFATNADRTCPIEGGEIPDAAAVIGALEGCSGRKVELVAGKPSAMIVDMVLEQLGLQTSDCLMAGDRLETDILMGVQAGMSTALVLTGVTQPEALIHSPVQPDFVLNSISEVSSLQTPS